MTTILGLISPKSLKIFKILVPTNVRYVSSKSDNAKEAPISYELVRLEQKCFADFLELMWSTYFKEEPISKTLCVSKSIILENYLHKILCGGHSFIAKTLDQGCIVGGCLNHLSSPTDADDLQDIACSVTDKKLRTLLKIWSFMQKSPDLWTDSSAPKIFDIGQPFVHKLERGKGIGQNLLDCSIKSATNCGYPLIRFAATGCMGACLAERLKMNLIHEIPYQNYVDQDCHPVVQPAAPNYSIKVYISKPAEK